MKLVCIDFITNGASLEYINSDRKKNILIGDEDYTLHMIFFKTLEMLEF